MRLLSHFRLPLQNRSHHTLFAIRLSTVLAATLIAACGQLPQMRATPPVTLDAARLGEIDRAIEAVIAEKKTPGAVIWVERAGVSNQKAFGKQTYAADAPAIQLDTLFDAASLTKVIATAPSVMLLAERGKINIDGLLVSYFPECANGGKEKVTIRQLLTHTSGMPPSLPGKPAWRGSDTALAMACTQVLGDPPGTVFRYSDINYVLLGKLVEKTSGLPLNEFAAQNFYQPLKMTHTGFLPLRRFPLAQIAPTQQLNTAETGATLHSDLQSGELLQGVVHDPTARYMGGVGGSAGLFTTAGDLARFARMMLNEGELDGVRVLSRATVQRMTSIQSPPDVKAKRGLGWDIDTAYSRTRGSVFPIGSYGHTGFTGTIVWIDPASQTFYVFVSNRVFPNDKANILALYSQLGTLSAQAGGFYPAVAPAKP
jgi:CubicO group peptidase (beta-lactamase class C family)